MHLGGRTATGSRSSVMCLSLGHKLHNFPELELFRKWSRESKTCDLATLCRCPASNAPQVRLAKYSRSIPEPARDRGLAPASLFEMESVALCRLGGMLGALKLALAPDRSRHKHHDDSEDPQHDLAAMAAIGELRRHAERFEESIEARHRPDR